MKRPNEGVVGWRRASDLGFDVAGSPLHQAKMDVASFRHALNDPLATRESDTDLLAEFEDFMSGGESFMDGTLPVPDPGFQERLRRRLWRTQLLTQQPHIGDSH
jgi:hypothetical protein